MGFLNFSGLQRFKSLPLCFWSFLSVNSPEFHVYFLTVRAHGWRHHTGRQHHQPTGEAVNSDATLSGGALMQPMLPRVAAEVSRRVGVCVCAFMRRGGCKPPAVTEECGRLPAGAHRGLIWADLSVRRCGPPRWRSREEAVRRAVVGGTLTRRDGGGRSRTCSLDEWNVKVRRIEGRWRLMSEEESVISKKHVHQCCSTYFHKEL